MIKPLHARSKKDEEMASKYPAFRRNDLHKISRPVLYLLAPLVFVKFIMGWSAACLNSLIVQVIVVGHKFGTPIPIWRQKLITPVCHYLARVMLASVSAYTIDMQNVNLDYKKYLGPDSKLTFENPSTVVSNHQSMMDVVVHTLRQAPSHVAKASTRKLPILGTCAEILGCLFFDRGDKRAS
jgi:hypothetical protein